MVVRCVIFSIQYSLDDDCFNEDGEKAAAEPARARIEARQNFIVFFVCISVDVIYLMLWLMLIIMMLLVGLMNANGVGGGSLEKA